MYYYLVSLIVLVAKDGWDLNLCSNLHENVLCGFLPRIVTLACHKIYVVVATKHENKVVCENELSSMSIAECITHKLNIVAA